MSNKIPDPPYFYEYRQNNSGGRFDDNLSHYILIEANSWVEASKKAKSIGLYFNGIAKGLDCGCCGDRWHDSPDVYTEPAIYGIPAREYKSSMMWGGKADTISIYYLDGKVEEINIPKGENKDGEYKEVPEIRLNEPSPPSGRWVEDE